MNAPDLLKVKREETPSEVKDPGKKVIPCQLFGFGGFRLMTEWDERAHQRHINDSCVKSSLFFSYQS